MGDVVNERSVTSSQIEYGRDQVRNDYVDNAARIEATNDLSITAGRDINNFGGTLQSGRDTILNAGRDVNIASAQATNSLDRGVNKNSSTITQYGASVSSGQDISVQAGGDINIVASQIDAKRDVDMAATDDITISSAADEQHFLYKSKKLTIQEDHVIQVKAEITAGGHVDLDAGKNLTMIASRIAAGDEAYLAAGEKLQLLAAQNSNYSLFDEKKNGNWGSKKTQRDEVTDVKNIGSEIVTGGDLSLISGGDQLYQAARLSSSEDLIINSGGSVTFEAVKDLHQESHEKSNTSLAWTSMSGKGSTDETLRQTQMAVEGDIVIRALDGLHIDVKQVNRQTVTQSIDAMVQADSQLAWLKDVEKRGDVDWRQVKEVHDAYKYSHSGLGAGAQLIIAILVVYFTAGLASGLIGAGATVGSGTAMAAAGTASASAVAGGAAVGSTVAAGWANVALTAVATSAASNATISFINNGGNLGAVFESVTSTNALKSYISGALSAGFVAGVLDPTFGVTGDNINKVTKGFDLGSIDGIGKFAAYSGAQGVTQAAIGTAVQGGRLGDNLNIALSAQLQSTLQAVAFNAVGDYSKEKSWADSSAEKIALHALVGGLLSQAGGGSFATGALAAGANEALVTSLAKAVNNNPGLLLVASQLVGITAAAITDGDLQKGAEIAKNATAYNYLNHHEVDDLVKDLKGCRTAADPSTCRADVASKYKTLSDKTTNSKLNGCAGEVGCFEQLEAVDGATKALDKYASDTGLGPEERSIIQDFQDSNFHDYVIARNLWLTGFHKEVTPIILSGGGAAVTKAEGNSGKVIVTEAEAAIVKGRLRIDPNGKFSQSEIDSAYHMAAQGKLVELRSPVGTRAGGGTSDLLVNGVPYDVYTPTTGNAGRIISAIAKKNSQAEGIVLDLSKSSVTKEQLGDVLSRVKGAGAKNINDIVIIGK